MANLHREKLTDRKVKYAKPGKYTDGHGLMLWVSLVQRDMSLMKHAIRRIAAACLSASLTAVPASSLAIESVAQWTFDRAGACTTALSGDSANWADGSHCISERLGGFLVDEAARFMTEHGQGVFGEHFNIVHRMKWSPLGKGLAGELDAVVPLAFRDGTQHGANGNTLHGSAFFLQHGMTRWTDEHGDRRHDMRLGTAFRFTLPQFTGANVVGTTALLQENVERGHQRFVIGMDYAGQWGHAALQHYLPTTGWRAGRAGFEERAAGGSELSLQLDMTTTMSLDAAMGQWERDGAGRTALDGHIGLGWKPHPYLSLNARTGIGPETDAGAFMLSLNVPFGGSHTRPIWEGLGTFALAGDGNTTSANLFRPVENVGQIRTIARAAAAETTTADGVTVRFLQSSATNGGTVDVEVSLSASATADVRLTVRLAPGSGDNPAVAGVDYIDAPEYVTIAKGATSGRVTFQLLHNPAQGVRMLGVTVTRS